MVAGHMAVPQFRGPITYCVLQWCHPMLTGTQRRTSCSTRMITLFGDHVIKLDSGPRTQICNERTSSCIQYYCLLSFLILYSISSHINYAVCCSWYNHFRFCRNSGLKCDFMSRVVSGLALWFMWWEKIKETQQKETDSPEWSGPYEINNSPQTAWQSELFQVLTSICLRPKDITSSLVCYQYTRLACVNVVLFKSVFEGSQKCCRGTWKTSCF